MKRVPTLPHILTEPIQEFFGLTYASYFVMPRSVLQSMPVEWQARFVAMIDEIDDVIEFPPNHEKSYWVRAHEGRRFCDDPLRDYDRGRRMLPYKKEYVEE